MPRSKICASSRAWPLTLALGPTRLAACILMFSAPSQAFHRDNSEVNHPRKTSDLDVSVPVGYHWL